MRVRCRQGFTLPTKSPADSEGRKSYIEEVASCNTVALFDDKIGVHLVCSLCHAPLVRWLQSLVTTNYLVSVHHLRSYKINLSGFS